MRAVQRHQQDDPALAAQGPAGPAVRFRRRQAPRGFLLGSVERFFAGHKDQVARGTNFSQVGDAERDADPPPGAAARRPVPLLRREIGRRIARAMNRSPLTILHTIRKHDEEHPDHAIFPQRRRS